MKRTKRTRGLKATSRSNESDERLIERTIVDPEYRERFLSNIFAPPAPNAALKAAYKSYKARIA